MAHLVCSGHTRDELTEILTKYRDCGVENILALRGDPPVAGRQAHQGELDWAIDLVELAKELGEFCVAVAAHPEGHPESTSLDQDRRDLAAKLAVADFGITQFFFKASYYWDMVETLGSLGVSKPVIPGIMPITSYGSIQKMAELSGAKIPPEIISRLERCKEREQDVVELGIEIACELSQELLDQGAPGLHIFTMNLARSTREIFERLGLFTT